MNKTLSSAPMLNRSGFSLIEVLISVVVLSFGLLALSALQARLIRSGADSKAQTIAMGLAKEKLEELRTFGRLSPAPSGTPATISCPASTPAAIAQRAYLCITSSPAAESLNDSAGSMGGVNFTRSWTVRRYGVASSTATNFTGPLASNTSPTLPSGYVAGNEFKTIEVLVTWTDAEGTQRNIRMEDAVAGINPADSAKALRYQGGKQRKPRVRIWDPGEETGVIPIAVGGGSESAATNPKPVNMARSGDDAVETRFDVLTYNQISGGTAQAQARVETTVVGCTCTNSAPSPSEPGYRPTYWDGFRYVIPERNTANAPGRVATGTGVIQSQYCTACCRDHHDAGATGPKFSPRRATHTHYRLNSSNALVPAASGENYLEACRLIRIDGIFSTATDMSNDLANLVATESSGDDPAPDDVASGDYRNFVLSYLNSRYVTSTQRNERFTPTDPVTVAADNNLNAPAELTMAATGSKWLHARGLYVDYLDTDALAAVGDAASNCTNSTGGSPSTEERRDCVLRVLPFTSINLTEIADWTPLSGTQIRVINDDFSTSAAITTPVRGKVLPGTLPTNNSLTDAVARVGSSNSGVAIFGDINPDETPAILSTNVGYWTDSQPIRIGASTPGPSGGSFSIGLANYTVTSSDAFQAGFTYVTRDGVCSGLTSNANPLTCTTNNGEPLPMAMKIRVGNYVRQGNDQLVNPCATNKTTTIPYIVDYDVTGFTSSNLLSVIVPDAVPIRPRVPGTITAGGEYTEALVTPIAQGDVITATMSAPSYFCPQNYPGAPGADYQCVGNGASAQPTWSTIWTACPASVTGNGANLPNFP